ncbi:hypothetical protein [Natrinema marinum]|uniref:hypothetical protein n=1 Tax=Natrinema marinum TaxID=2961598 RepID=UPI0020C8D9A3|nr:hypothetical protein [Natrinema marinum]
MRNAAADPHCPECGEPVGQTAAYCMHCWTDLPDGPGDTGSATLDTAPDEAWGDSNAGPVTANASNAVSGTPSAATGSVDATSSGTATGSVDTRPSVDAEADELLDPSGLVDNTLTAVVGIVGGLIVGIVGIFVLSIIAGGSWAGTFGLIAWLGSTGYLVRRRTVQEAVAKSAYAVALVLLSVPIIAFSPAVTMQGGLEERGGFFVVLCIFVAVPAAVAAAIGWVASRFVPSTPDDAAT